MNLHLVPLHFSNMNLLNQISFEVSRRLQANVEISNLPVDINKAYNKERGQYFSTLLLQDMVLTSQKLDGKVMGLVDVDLFVPVFTYVFGEAQLSGKNSIVSVFRFHEEIYTGKTDDDLLYERTLKEVLHELGHNFGLLHCKDWNCVMHTSQGIEEVDIKGNFYCADCHAVVKSNLIYL